MKWMISSFEKRQHLIIFHWATIISNRGRGSFFEVVFSSEIEIFSLSEWTNSKGLKHFFNLCMWIWKTSNSLHVPKCIPKSRPLQIRDCNFNSVSVHHDFGEMGRWRSWNMKVRLGGRKTVTGLDAASKSLRWFPWVMIAALWRTSVSLCTWERLRGEVTTVRSPD